MWELDCEEAWVPKNWCFWTVVLEKTLESPSDWKEIQPVHSEGDQPWDFFGRNDAKAETPEHWPPHVKSWLIGKDSDAGRDWRQKEKGTTEDEMAGWHHWLDGRESELTPGVGDEQESLACCNLWGRKESDTTERLNWTKLNCISESIIDYDGYSISSKGFLPTVGDIMVIWVNSPIPVHISSLIPRMSKFTLAISCLTRSIRLMWHRKALWELLWLLSYLFLLFLLYSNNLISWIITINHLKPR